MMHTLRVELVQQIVRPKNSRGVDWGNKIRVLARRGPKEMWSSPGCSICYRSIFGSEYIPGEVVLVDDAERYYNGHNGKTIQLGESSRVSKRLFKEWAKTIDEFFGCEVASKLHRSMTLLIYEEEEADSKNVAAIESK